MTPQKPRWRKAKKKFLREQLPPFAGTTTPLLREQLPPFFKKSSAGENAGLPIWRLDSVREQLPPFFKTAKSGKKRRIRAGI
jgi:hypothetical protein